MNYTIKRKIKRFNYEKTGPIKITWQSGNVIEVTNDEGGISYITTKHFKKLIKEKKIKKL